MTAEDIPEIRQHKVVTIRKARRCAECGHEFPVGARLRYVILLKQDKQLVYYHCGDCTNDLGIRHMLVSTPKNASQTFTMPYTMRRSEP